MSGLHKSATIGVIGAGTMGSGIAQTAATAGHHVLLFDVSVEIVEKGIFAIKRQMERQVEKGKITLEEMQQLLARIHPCFSMQDLAKAELVIEAILEDLEIKSKVFKELESIVSSDCILATNTSSLSITAIGASLEKAERFVGMHFFNPVPLMALVEVISGLATSNESAQKVFDTAKSWGKSPVYAKSTPGFIVNRVARPFYAEGLRVLSEGGADVPTIDALMREMGGFRMGPFELMDLIGNDVNFAVTSSVYTAYFHDPRFLPSLTQQEMVAAGYLGRKSGRGFYEYGEDVRPQTPATAAPAPPPIEVYAQGSLGAAKALIPRIEQAGIMIRNSDSGNRAGWLEVGSAVLKLTDGRTATQRAAEEGVNDLILFDLVLDYSKAGRIAIAPADQCSTAALEAAVGLFQKMDMEVSIFDDCPGLILMRTLSMLANEGADTVNQKVCSASAVDTAMLKGLNYPKGPLAWADSIGADYILNVLDNLAATYGEDRYRASVLLRRKAHSGGKLNECY